MKRDDRKELIQLRIADGKHHDELFRLRSRLAAQEAEIAQLKKKLERAETQSSAFRASVEGLTALIASVGLSTGK